MRYVYAVVAALSVASCAHRNELSGLQDCATRAASAQAIANRRDASDIPNLVEALDPAFGGTCQEGTPDPTPAVAAALATFGPAAVEPSLAALPLPQRTLGAALVLGELNDRRAVEPLIAQLRQMLATAEFGEAYPAIVAALGTLGGEAVVPALFEAAFRTPGIAEDAAAAALASLTAARDPLLHGLNGPSAAERAEAADVLGRTGDPRIVELLVDHLRDQDGSVREQVLQALARLGLSTPGSSSRLHRSARS